MGSLWEEGLFIGVPGEISKSLSRNGLTSAFFSTSLLVHCQDLLLNALLWKTDIQNIDTYT